MDLTENAIEKLLYTGRSQQQIQDDPHGEPFAILPNGSVLNLAPYYAPRIVRAAVEFTDAASFCEYVNRFKCEDTTIFATVDGMQGVDLVAVLDYHHAGTDGEHQARRCNHRARFLSQFTPEHLSWMNANRQPMSQVEFATWLEDNLLLFNTPEGTQALSGAALLEFVVNLHGHQNARFSSAVKMQVQATSVAYEEDVVVKGVNTTTKSESMDLPKKLYGKFALFKGGEPVTVSARLKVRIENRQMRLWFETENVPQMIAENATKVLEAIKTKTGITPLMGRAMGVLPEPVNHVSPEMARDITRAGNYRGALGGAF